VLCLSGVARFLQTLAVTAVLGQIVCGWAFASTERCAAPCSEGDSGSDCPTGCGACACCAPHRTVLPGGVGVCGAPRTGERIPVAILTRPLSPEPREILHVPKSLLV